MKRRKLFKLLGLLPFATDACPTGVGQAGPDVAGTLNRVFRERYELTVEEENRMVADLMNRAYRLSFTKSPTGHEP